jgi:hypothetical protein
MLAMKTSDIPLKLDMPELPIVHQGVLALDQMDVARHLTLRHVAWDHFCCRKKGEARAH